MPHCEMVNWFSRWWDKRVLDPKNDGDMKSYCLASDAWFAAFKTMDENFTGAQHTQAKMPSWGEVTKGITFSTVGERDVAAEVFSRVARHFGCA